MKGRVADTAASARLARVLGLVAKYSKSLNLSGASTGDERGLQAGEAVLGLLAVEAVLGRSLSARDRWLDVGSGGGFPGLVIAALSAVDLHLLEPRQRRASFLEMGMGACGRRGGVVHRGHLTEKGLDGVGESLRAWVGEGVDVASARAVFSPSVWLDRSRLLVRPGGLVVLHLHAGDASPAGCVERGRFEWSNWAAVVVEPLG